MNLVREAIFRTVYHYKEGVDGAVEELAARLTQSGHKMSPQILRNKACRTNHTNHFQPEQLICLQKITGDYQINAAFVATEDKEKPKAETFDGSLLLATEQLGKAIGQIKGDLADGVLTPTERANDLAILAELSNTIEGLKNKLIDTPQNLTAVGGGQ